MENKEKSLVLHNNTFYKSFFFLLNSLKVIRKWRSWLRTPINSWRLLQKSSGGMALYRKALLAGFFWPTMKKDATTVVKKCKSYERHANPQWRSAKLMKVVISTCPFEQWVLDIVDPFFFRQHGNEILNRGHWLLLKLGRIWAISPDYWRQGAKVSLEKYFLSFTLKEGLSQKMEDNYVARKYNLGARKWK